MKYFVLGGKWFDKVNGNTYHTAKIISEEGETIYSRFQYGYGAQYMESAKEELENRGISDFELVNLGSITGLKRDIKNGNF